MSQISNLKQKKIQQTQSKILKCAQDLFEKKGYNNVSFEEIAETALVSRSTLYKYYENKQTLFFDIHNENIRKVVDFSQQFSVSATGKQMILEMCDKMMQSFNENWINSYILDEFIKNNRNNENEQDLSKIQSSSPDPLNFRYKTLKESIEDYFGFLARFMQMWEKCFQIGLNDGSITTNLTASQVITYIRLYLVGIMDQSQIKGNIPDPERIQLNFMNIKKITLKNISCVLEMQLE